MRFRLGRNSFNCLTINFALIVAGLFVFAPSADAYPRCEGKVRIQVDPWREGVLYWYPRSILQPHIVEVGQISSKARLGYYYCPNGNKPNKIHPRWIEWCFTRGPGAEREHLRAVRFNARIYDHNGKTLNPPRVSVTNGPSDRNCHVQWFEDDDLKWFRTRNGPRWVATLTPQVTPGPDTTWHFKTADGGTVNRIDYFNAEFEGPWHNLSQY